MMFQEVFWVLTLLVGSFAIPVRDDLSMFFDHTDADARIVGGAAAERVPWMVALTNGVLIRSYWCGASILSNRHLLTAAHCIASIYDQNGLSRSFMATVGTNRWNHGGVHYTIARNITHPHYVRQSVKNDIAILVTTNSIRFSDAISPVTLDYSHVGNGVATTINGWGMTAVNEPMSPVLLELHATTVDGNVCMKEIQRVAKQFFFQVPPVESHIEICAFNAVNRGVCNGDSGSPLLRRSNRRQIGVVSWGVPCARGAPDVFARVSAYRSWIQRSIQ